MRIASLILLGVAGLFLIFGVLTKSWFEIDRGNFHFGLWGACYGDQCAGSESYKLSMAKKGTDKAFIVAGRVTFIAGLIAAGLLALTTLLIGIRAPAALASARSAIGVTGLATIAAIVFMALKPDAMHGADVGAGLFLFLTGAASGITGAILGLRPEAMMASPLPPRPMGASASAPAPACVSCGAPTRWVQQYQRHYCDACRLYV